MGFQNIQKIEKPDFYLGIVFRAAANEASKERGKGKKLIPVSKAKNVELTRIHIVNKSLNKLLNNILISFPNFEELTPFYQEMILNFIDYVGFKKSLGAVNWCKIKVTEFSREYSIKIKKSRDVRKISEYRQQHYGRVSSLLKRIKKEMLVLESIRRTMKEFPSIKELPTVCICGFPNVGKSTLLSKITTAKPEIKAYAFTTKTLNVGYIITAKKKIQVIDAPGTLDRFEKMNTVEKQAHLAIKHCANLLIYVFDVTEPYPIEQQIRLYNNLKKENKPMLLYLSKTDVIKKEDIEEFKKKFDVIGLNQLKEEILRIL